jgi:DNA repair protein RecO (recombination protein O)
MARIRLGHPDQPPSINLLPQPVFGHPGELLHGESYLGRHSFILSAQVNQSRSELIVFPLDWILARTPTCILHCRVKYSPKTSFIVTASVSRNSVRALNTSKSTSSRSFFVGRRASLRRDEEMSSQISECIVLRTYPYKEADLVVSFFTRDQGKLRGIARRARKPSSKFGAGLERLAHGKMQYFLAENRELATLDGCEVIGDSMNLSADYDRSVAGDFLAEAAEQLLPMAEPNEKFFRLILAVTSFLASADTPTAVWPAVTYFCLWAVKLEGFLPPMSLTEEDRAIAEEMLARPIPELTPAAWSHEWAAELRHSLIGLIEEHTERRLVTVKYLEGLGGR